MSWLLVWLDESSDLHWAQYNTYVACHNHLERVGGCKAYIISGNDFSVYDKT